MHLLNIWHISRMLVFWHFHFRSNRIQWFLNSNAEVLNGTFTRLPYVFPRSLHRILCIAYALYFLFSARINNISALFMMKIGGPCVCLRRCCCQFDFYSCLAGSRSCWLNSDLNYLFIDCWRRISGRLIFELFHLSLFEVGRSFWAKSGSFYFECFAEFDVNLFDTWLRNLHLSLINADNFMLLLPFFCPRCFPFSSTPFRIILGFSEWSLSQYCI